MISSLLPVLGTNEARTFPCSILQRRPILPEASAAERRLVEGLLRILALRTVKVRISVHSGADSTGRERTALGVVSLLMAQIALASHVPLLSIPAGTNLLLLRVASLRPEPTSQLRPSPPRVGQQRTCCGP